MYRQRPCRQFLLGLVFMMPAVSGLQAAEPFTEGVPDEIVGYLVDGDLYQSLPDDFPPLELPAEVTVLAAIDSERYRRVLIETGQNAEDSLALVSGTLEEAGWVNLSGGFSAMAFSRGVFVPANAADQPVQPLLFCHDDYGNATVNMAGDGVVSLTNNSFSGNGVACSDQQSVQGRPPARMTVLQDNAPRLVLPEDASTPSMMGGFSGSSNDLNTEISVAFDGEFAALLPHFADQLTEQGWQQDSTWQGEITAGSSWTREVDGIRLLGILSIVTEEAGSYRLGFRLVRLGQTVSGASLRPVLG